MHVEDIRPEGWACTYLVANNGEAVLIDPVYDYINHYETVLAERGLNLVGCMATHTHADHITAALHSVRTEAFRFTCGKTLLP